MNILANLRPDGDLEFRIDTDGQQELRDMRNDTESGFSSDAVMHEVFERVIANHEYEWCLPEYVGALTGAPMLAIFGEPVPLPAGASAVYHNVVSQDENGVNYAPVLKVWAYMDYQVRSPLDDLADDGVCVFSYSELETKE